MTGAPEVVPPQLVGDIVAAVRLELSYSIPLVLAPLVDELKDLKSLNAIQKDPVHDKLYTAPAVASCVPDLAPAEHAPFHSGVAAAVGERPSDSPSTGDPAIYSHVESLPPPLADADEGDCEDATAGDQQTVVVSAPLKESCPRPMEIVMSRQSLGPGTPVEESSVHSVPREVSRCWSWRHLYGEQGLDQKEGYHLIPPYETTDELATDSYTMDAEDPDGDIQELNDPEAARRLPHEIAGLEAKVGAAYESLEDLDAHWKNRRRPYEEDIASVRKEIDDLQVELEFARTPKVQDPTPPGPAVLQFVTSTTFDLFCNFVVMLNLAEMCTGPSMKSYGDTFKVLDQVFLAWYIVEFCIKAVYYQHHLILGKLNFVCWNYLDLGIVVGGVIDQWLMPLLSAEHKIDTSALRMLRTLRLFRIMRFLRIIKAFLNSDFAWTETPSFEFWMAMVIAFNSVVMSLELDFEWTGWLYIENFLQIVYTFELAVRLKRQCCHFFYDMDNVVWNYLDIIIVAGGACDLWLVPLFDTMREIYLGEEASLHSSSLTGVLKTLRIMRILRVLRLVRLLKVVKPLYRLLIGAIASLKAMQWVLILTFLTLYACAIIFTYVVGEGLLSNGEISENANRYFGSVPRSLFSLFKLMNGDTYVVEPITGSIEGKLLFVGFTVVSKWAILAILTSVVSDNMITTSQKANEEDAQRQNEADHVKRIRRLTALFKEIDGTGRGTITTRDWQNMLADKSLHRELCDATGLHEEDLNDYFECLAKDPRQEERNNRFSVLRPIELKLDYRTFIDALKDEGVLADKRSILHVMKQLRILESHVKKEFDDVKKEVDELEHTFGTHNSLR